VRACPLVRIWSTVHFRAYWLPLSLSIATATTSSLLSVLPFVMYLSTYKNSQTKSTEEIDPRKKPTYNINDQLPPSSISYAIERSNIKVVAITKRIIYPSAFFCLSLKLLDIDPCLSLYRD
jgi:hypothetical protein